MTDQPDPHALAGELDALLRTYERMCGTSAATWAATRIGGLVYSNRNAILAALRTDQDARPAAEGVREALETFASINDWCDTTFGKATIPQIIARAKEEFDELEAEDADHAIEAADVVICLCRIPGFDEALQRKMAINRGRKWRLVGNGTGYHIPEPQPDAVAAAMAERESDGYHWSDDRFGDNVAPERLR